MVSKIEQQSTAVSLTNVSSAPKDIKIAMEEGRREAKSIFREVLCQVPTPPITVANLLEPSPTLPASSLPSLQPPREEIDKTAMVTVVEQARVVVREVLRKAILRTNQWLVFYEDGDECIEHEDDLNRE
jgi:hypothetical protein